MDKRKIFSCVVESYVRSRWDVKDVSSCAIFPHNFYKAYYTFLNT